MKKIICPLEQCTGCMACVNSCPKQCIRMVEGEMGHWYPEVNMEVCVDCGMCERVCPTNHPVKKSVPLTAYAGWHKNIDEYHSSTSGGAAAALSQKMIAMGGVVYGCSSLPGLEIKHVRIDRMENLVQLKGSKYVQSFIGDVYKQVKKDLQQNLNVLFVGTPCQIAGLKNFLRKDYPSLYTVDLICHGVPSQAVLKQHVKRVSGNRGVRVQFRKGNDMGLRIFDDRDEMIYYSNVWYSRYKDVYFNTFIDGYTYRPSCYQCQYARKERCSDITIGDFWGIGTDFKHDTVNGCSCMLPITEKGKKILEDCQLDLYERTVDEAVLGNDQLRSPKKYDVRRRWFRKLNHWMGVGVAYRLCELDHILDKWVIQRIKRRLTR